ncbi:MAG: SIMPL domain-containing protein [Pyrinomonadaceae bacterium]
MRKSLCLIILSLLLSTALFAQDAGNRAYGTQKRRPQASTGQLTANADAASRIYFVEANVLMNVKADAYNAVFAVVQNGTTAAESNAKINTQIAGFTKDLGVLDVRPSDIFVDFITQNKVYDYTTAGTVITEKLSGFETKKNVVVRYKNRELLEKILSAATKNSIFDLIEVEYVVNDIPAIQARLADEAVKVVKRKEASYGNSFGIKMAGTNVANEKYDAFYPAVCTRIIRLTKPEEHRAIITGQ